MAVPNKLAGRVTARGVGERVGRFVREVRAEVRKVSWPTRRELVAYTVVVLVSVTIVAAFLGLVDLAISSVLALLTRLGG